MKNIDIIRPGTLKTSIGPTGTIKRIIKNRSFFKNKGFEINVFTHDNLTTQIQTSQNNISTKSKKNTTLKIKYRLRELSKKSALLGSFYIVRDYLKVKKLTSYYFKLDRNPDAVIFHSVFECFQFLKKNKKTVKTALFFHTDGIPLKMLEIYNPKLKGSLLFKKLYKMEVFTIKEVNEIVFITNIGRKNFLEHYPFIDKNKTSIILNGIDDIKTKNENSKEVEKLIEKKIKYKLCCIGTINERKGQRIIIEALKKINHQALENIHLTLIGSGPDLYYLERLVKEYNLTNNVLFTGNIPNENIPAYLKAFNIYILMSYNEGLPISIIEAMRAGLPVVSTRVSGIPELVTEGLNGLLLDPDIDQLAKILNDMDKFDWGTMGNASRNEFETRFTFERMKSEYCEMLEKLFG